MTEVATRTEALIHAFYERFARSVGGRVVERDGVTACIGVHPSPIITNTAWRSDPGLAATRVLPTVDAIYADLGFEGSLLTSKAADADLEQVAADAGRKIAIELPVMALAATSAPRMWHTPPGVTTRPLRPETDLAAFRSVLRDGFFEGEAETSALVDATFASPASVTSPDIGIVVAELDGRTVSVAGAWLVEGGAGVGWVATLPEARRRGIGALVTARAVEFAVDHGADLVVLEASPEGLHVYEQLGFQTVGRHTIWEAAAPA